MWDLWTTERKVGDIFFNIILGNGGYKKCVIVENQSSIAIDGYKAFNFDYVADEDIQQSVIF